MQWDEKMGGRLNLCSCLTGEELTEARNVTVEAGCLTMEILLAERLHAARQMVVAVA